MQTLAKYKKICYHKQADLDNDKKRPHGQAVKTLPSHGRICGSIPHGATKKERHPRDVVLFWYTPKRNDAATCCRRSSICASKFLPYAPIARTSAFLSVTYGKRQLPHGAILLRCVERRGNLFAVVRQFAQANSCRGTPFYGSRENPNEHANGNGNFRMGLHTSSVRGKNSATSFLYDKRFFRLNTI